MEVYVHGVGSSAKGNEYHHEVTHMVEDGRALCGIVIAGDDWWKDYISFTAFLHKEEKRTGRPEYASNIICQRCARVYQLRNKK